MKYNLRKFTVGIILLAVIVFTLSYAVFASYDVKILVDGERLECEASPIIKDGTTLVPMRDVFEGLGAVVSWDDQLRTATGTYKDVTVEISSDGGSFLKNGEALELSVKPIIMHDRILIPLRAVAESFGYNVMWRGEDYTVSISTKPSMKTYFLDSGQADSIFIELPDGKCMLIDAAEAEFGKTLESFILSKGYSHIDYIVATHPHSDHIGGMGHILKSFSVGKFYMPEILHTTKTFERMVDALEKNGCECIYIRQGSVIEDFIYDIDVLAPLRHDYLRMNNYSAVIKLSYNNISTLFSADAEIDSEREMIESNLDIKADVLKVGHHGSATSTSEEYLDRISPKDAIISVGEKNSYGFPDPLVEARLNSRGINIHRTDILGNICMTTDGYIYVIEGDQ